MSFKGTTGRKALLGLGLAALPALTSVTPALAESANEAQKTVEYDFTYLGQPHHCTFNVYFRYYIDDQAPETYLFAVEKWAGDEGCEQLANSVGVSINYQIADYQGTLDSLASGSRLQFQGTVKGAVETHGKLSAFFYVHYRCDRDVPDECFAGVTLQPK